MALQTTDLSPRGAPAALIAPGADAEPVRMACRCEGCGGTVTFDALIVSCACADEEPPRTADSTLH